MKASELFPLMDKYVDVPTPERWTAIIAATTALLGAIDEGLTEIDRNASFKEAGDKVYYLTKDEHFVVDRQLFEAFLQIHGFFNGRKTIIGEMMSAGQLPDVELVSGWKGRLLDLHVKLDVTLNQLLVALDKPAAPL